MEENEENPMELICPNCGYVHLEGMNEHFCRYIFENTTDTPWDDDPEQFLPESVNGLQCEIQEREPREDKDTIQKLINALNKRTEELFS